MNPMYLFPSSWTHFIPIQIHLTLHYPLTPSRVKAISTKVHVKLHNSTSILQFQTNWNRLHESSTSTLLYVGLFHKELLPVPI